MFNSSVKLPEGTVVSNSQSFLDPPWTIKKSPARKRDPTRSAVHEVHASFGHWICRSDPCAAAMAWTWGAQKGARAQAADVNPMETLRSQENSGDDLTCLIKCFQTKFHGLWLWRNFVCFEGANNKKRTCLYLSINSIHTRYWLIP